MEFLKNISEYFFSNEVKSSSKLWYAIILCFIVFVINDLTSFTSNIRLNNKITTIENLEKLKLNNKDSVVVKFCDDKINQVVNNDGIVQSVYNYLSSSLMRQYNADTNEITNVKSININHFFWFFFTSGGVYYFIGILMFPILIFAGSSNSIGQRVSEAILALFVLISFGGLFSLICSFIPELIEGHLWVNYILNAVIQIGVMYLVYKMTNKT